MKDIADIYKHSMHPPPSTFRKNWGQNKSIFYIASDRNNFNKAARYYNDTLIKSGLNEILVYMDSTQFPLQQSRDKKRCVI